MKQELVYKNDFLQPYRLIDHVQVMMIDAYIIL